MISDKMRPVHQEHVPAANRGVAAFRTAWKHALKKATSSTKQQGVELPVWVKRLHELVAASSADIVDVGLSSNIDPALLSKGAA
eukprot:5050619-Lingulodinium_polyedra.AAC.1